jgi:hypothetical protein
MTSAHWRDRLQDAPLWVLFLCYLPFGPLAAGMYLLIEPDMTALGAVVFAVIAGPMFAAAMMGAAALMRDRDHAVVGGLSHADKVALACVFRTEVLPANRELDDRILTLLARRRKQCRDSLIYNPTILGILVVLEVISALTRSAWFWVLAAIVLGLLVGAVISTRRNLAKFERLATSLRARQSEANGGG